MLNGPVTILVEAVALLNIICLSEKGKGLGFLAYKESKNVDFYTICARFGMYLLTELIPDYFTSR